MKCLLNFFLVAAAAFTAAVPRAGASTLTVNSLGFGQSVAMIVDGTPKNSTVKQINITLDNVARYAFCVDLFTLINYATYNSNLGTPDMINNGLRVAWLLDEYDTDLANGQVNNEVAAALQLAIWDLVHDNGDGFSAGRVQLAATVSATLLTAANSNLTSSVGQSSTNATLLFNTAVSTGVPAQTLITTYVPTPSVENPEPSTLVLLGAGILAMGLGRIRHKRTR